MADAYAYAAEHDSQDMEDQARQIARCVAKLKGSSRNSQLRVLAGLLDQLPQDVNALGPAKDRDVLLDSLCEKAILHSKQKDVKMYAAACFAQLLRIYAPETPYEDKQLEVSVRCCPLQQSPQQQSMLTPVSAGTLCLPHTSVVVLFLLCSLCLTCCYGV